MSFVSVLSTGQLPEKPWQTGAVARFGASVAISMLMIGGMSAMVLRYFEIPGHSSPTMFLIFAITAFAFTLGALVILLRSWADEKRLLFNLIVLLVCINGGMLFAWLAGRYIPGKMDLQNPLETMVVAVVSFQGAALILATFFLREQSSGWIDGFGLNRHAGQSLLIGIGIGALVLYPVLQLNELFFHLFEKLTLHPQEQQAVEILRHADTLLGRTVSGIATVLIAPAGEEVIFRGVLYPWAKRTFSLQAALWGTAVLFGAIHLNLSSFVPLTLLAVVLIGLYEYTGNLLAPIAVHCVFNGANFIALFYQQK